MSEETKQRGRGGGEMSRPENEKLGSNDEEQLEHDGAPGCSQNRELSSASRGRKVPRPQREKDESSFGSGAESLKSVRVISWRGRNILMVEVVKKWRTRGLDASVSNQQR